MIKIGSSNVRKFQFFEVVNEPNSISTSKNEIKDSNKESTKLDQNKSNIEINNISLSGTGQMYAIDELIFINGKAIHEKDGNKVRENLIMKILDNKIIDEYRLFNGIYFYFSIKIYEEKPYFIVVGSDFNEHLNKGQKRYNMTTSIKIYDASLFIKNKTLNETKEEELGESEPYPESLIKNIKLLKRLSDEEFLSEYDFDKMEDFESIKNINSFSINDDFTNAAVNIDGGSILLVYGYPNLLECNLKHIKIIKLPQIILDDKLEHITNLDFTELNIKNEMKKVLYATTGKSIYYYIWKNETNSIVENDILLKALNNDGKGAYSGCISVKGKNLLIGSSEDDFIGEYDNLEFGKTWFFDGKKTIVKYYKDYILFVIITETESSLQIYDRKNQFFVYYQSGKNKINAICNDNNYLYVFYEESIDKKYIVKLREKNIKEKFETFFSKKFFDDAALYAGNLGFDKRKISEIWRKHAEYEYSKGDYDKSIEEYIKTIDYYEPSIVIQKFLEKSKLNYLIKYLEAIIFNTDFKIKDLEEHKNYTNLLLHCYIMQEEVHKLKEFLDKKGQFFSEDLIKTVIDVCLETENIDLSLSIAKQYNMIKEYLQILIINLYDYEEAINILEDPEKINFKINNQEKIKLYIEFSEYFLKIEEGNFSDKFFESVLNFIETNINDLEKKDIIKLIEIFIDSDKFFKILFEKMESYKLDYDKEMIHRRIQLYLDDLESDKKNVIYKEKILEIIKNERYTSKYDSQYLIMLFKNRHFLEGIEILSDIHKYNQDLLAIYMEKKEYEKIINLCINYGATELSFWGTSLNYFINKDFRKNLNKEEINIINQNLEKFLEKLLESKIIPSIKVLDIINEQNNEIPFQILNNFMSKSLKNDINSIEKELNNFNSYDNKINVTVNEIKELKTKAYTFNLIKCSECGEVIDLPSIAFKCGHGFHTYCLNITENNDNIECPKCKEGKNKVMAEIEECKSFYNKVNTLEKLENELGQKQNKINFIYELYGKGLFELGSIKENK